MGLKHIKNEIAYYFKTYGFIRTVRKVIVTGIKKIGRVFYCLVHGINPGKEPYHNWIKKNEPTELELEFQRKFKFEKNPKISLIVPLYKTPEVFFEQLVDCLINQTYTNWELALADGSEEKNPKIEEIAKKDERIKYKFLGVNKNISGNSNEALGMCTGDYIGLLDHDDLLPIFSLYEIVKCINEHPDAEFIYTDEDKIINKNNYRHNPYFKPDFAIDTLRANNYICHFSIYRKDLMEKLGGFRDKYNGAQDYDIILRMTENVTSYEHIYHIPKILYHWRIHEASTAYAGDAKPYAFEAGRLAVEDHIKRVGLKGNVTDGETIGAYITNYDVIGNPKVSIIIPNKDHKELLNPCIDSILKKSTYKNYEIIVVENNSEDKETFKYYKTLEKKENIKVVKYEEKEFNYSAIINYGVKHATGDYIVQLNNDTEIISKNWMEHMLGFAQRKDVGAVGARLYYEDGSLQHCGVIIGLGGIAGHILSGLPKGEHGYFSKDSSIQNLSAVTAACIMSRKEIYEEVGNMNEALPVAFNDIDFCLKIREKGYLIVYDAAVELMHYESKSRGFIDNKKDAKRFEKEIKMFRERWTKVLNAGDPYYSKNFSLERNDFSILERKV